MRVQLNFKSGQPAYLQIVEQIKYAAASGALRAGDFLPGIRPMAEELRINRNTVAKAYAELESQGIVETIPGKGCLVRENSSPFRKEVRARILTGAIDAAIVQAHHLQFSRDEFLNLAQQRLEFFAQKNPQPQTKKQG